MYSRFHLWADKEFGKGWKVLMDIPVFYAGWEMDDKAWLILTIGGEKKIVMTNHGSPYIASPAELLNKIVEYENVLEKTRRMILELRKPL